MRLSNYRFGSVQVDGVPYTEDIQVLPDGAVKSWWRKEGHRVLPEDLEEALAADPELVIIGTGYGGRVEVTAEARALLAERGIELLALKTAEAVEAFNEYSPKKRACALLHLTC
ncbi:MAG: hypothetical protein GXO72_00610 [Caldiserica bacterium]|nr:hypothetical protein [Caldisericota bacterium]